MKRLIALGVLLCVGSAGAPVRAQYYGSNNSTWNNPMSASADIIIQQNMERQRLKNSLRKKQAAKRRYSRKIRGNNRKARTYRKVESRKR